MPKKPIPVQPWDLVRLKDRTDRYRVYTYNGRTIFVGQNSDTVTDLSRDVVVKLLERDGYRVDGQTPEQGSLAQHLHRAGDDEHPDS